MSPSMFCLQLASSIMIWGSAMNSSGSVMTSNCRNGGGVLRGPT